MPSAPPVGPLDAIPLETVDRSSDALQLHELASAWTVCQTAARCFVVLLFSNGITLPALIPFTIQFGIALYRETRQQWVSGTRGTRIYLLTSAIVAVAAYLIILVGEFAGWEHRLWFSDA